MAYITNLSPEETLSICDSIRREMKCRAEQRIRDARVKRESGYQSIDFDEATRPESHIAEKAERVGPIRI